MAKEMRRETLDIPSIKKSWRELAQKESKPVPLGQTLQLTQEPPAAKKTPGGLSTVACQEKVSSVDDSDSELMLREVIGEGGMGRVYLADQIPLQREVVVKKALPGGDVKQKTSRLLQESLLTGRLQHPNIIPVYQLGLDDDGRPLLVMKRVQGEEWGKLLHREREDDQTPSKAFLERHIRILFQVCNAIAFAHSQGIIHRDIKPENVMVGSFGEVYLIDWGIAVSLREVDRGYLPFVSDQPGIWGTPTYMAPEMAEPSQNSLGLHTDIYLLGATLYEILTGEPPHQGEDITDMLADILDPTPPAFSESLPADIITICKKSMAFEPEERFPSVDAFREALEDFLLHRESYILGQAAGVQLQRFLKRLSEQKGRTLSRQEKDITEEAFRASYFGYRAALDVWKGNELARQELQSLLEHLISDALEREDVETPERWLSELPVPNVALESRWETMKREKEKRYQELERLAFEQDLTIGARTRQRITLTMAIVWGTLSILGDVSELLGIRTTNHWDYVGMNLLFALFLAFALRIQRKVLFENDVNRQVVGMNLLFVVVVLLQRIAYMVFQVPVIYASSLELIVFFNCICFFGIMYHRKIFWSAAIYPLALVGCLLWPARYQLFGGLAHLIALSMLSYFWSSPEIGQRKPSHG